MQNNITKNQDLKRFEESMEQTEDFLKQVLMRSVRGYFRTRSPEKFAAWGERCCRQGCLVIIDCLQELFPKIDWSIQESYFSIPETSDIQEHAWVLGQIDDKDVAVIDVTSQDRESIFKTLDGLSPFQIDKEEPYKSRGAVEKKREQACVKQMYETPEYFTGLHGEELMNEIKIFIMLTRGES